MIEAGQEEGILQEGDRDLIQSVVEFSGKTVRDAMKPRPDMVAVPVNTTVEQVIELLKSKPYSRIPVYEGSIHNIKGHSPHPGHSPGPGLRGAHPHRRHPDAAGCLLCP